MASVTDFCGLYSGEKVDKSNIFKVFYGELQTAPMINITPINIECNLTQTITSHHADFFIGEITGVYIDEEYLVDDKPKIERIDPLLYEDGLNRYWSLGKFIAEAFDIGKQFKAKPG